MSIEIPFLQKVIDSVSYRGPDAEGFYINKDKTVGLAHRRLSILDLSQAGRQPMHDETKEISIVFNGEIYNYLELKETLLHEGYRFVSTSDTEVLLYSYKKWGTDCLQHINGMFAFGILDSRENKLFIGRDRLGKKPLFYTMYEGTFIFSSELKEILHTGIVPVDLDSAAVNHYFALGYIPGEMCIVKGVKKLRAACSLELFIPDGTLQLRSYWDIPAFEEAKSEEEALEEIECLLSDAVKKRLMSDVPIGAFLSGGLDSSLVVAFMRKVHNAEIKTFSVAFEGSVSNETPYSNLVSCHFGTAHNEILIQPNLADDLELVSGLLDEPVYDNSLLPSYYIAKYTRQYVTVALSGDGGDEVFGGYIHYASALLAERIATFAFPPINKLAGYLSQKMPEGRFGRNTLLGISHGGKSSFVYPTLVFKPLERARMLRINAFDDLVLNAPQQYREKLMNSRYDFINQMCYADIKSELVDDILVKVDRASMFNSLEVRCPLLDYRIVEFCFRYVPGNLKIRRGIKKYLLKKLAARYLPKKLDIHRKQGFDIPGDLLARSNLVERLLSFPENEFVSKSYMTEICKSQERGCHYLWHKLFALYFFLRWVETWKK